MVKGWRTYATIKQWLVLLVFVTFAPTTLPVYGLLRRNDSAFIELQPAGEWDKPEKTFVISKRTVKLAYETREGANDKYFQLYTRFFEVPDETFDSLCNVLTAFPFHGFENYQSVIYRVKLYNHPFEVVRNYKAAPRDLQPLAKAFQRVVDLQYPQLSNELESLVRPWIQLTDGPLAIKLRWSHPPNLLTAPLEIAIQNVSGDSLPILKYPGHDLLWPDGEPSGSISVELQRKEDGFFKVVDHAGPHFLPPRRKWTLLAPGAEQIISFPVASTYFPEKVFKPGDYRIRVYYLLALDRRWLISDWLEWTVQ